MTSPSLETQSPWDTDDKPAAQEKVSPWHDAVLALSIAHLCFIHAANGLLFELYFGYFNKLPVNRASLAALLLNIFGLAAVLWLGGRLVRRINHRVLSSAAALIICATAVIPLNFARTHYANLGAAKVMTLFKEPMIMIAVIAAVLAALWFHRHAAKLVMTLYLILSPMVLFTVGKTAWYLIRPPAAPADVAPVSRPALTSPQVVWLLLDELDQRIAFEARPPDIAMPELTRLYNECFHATNAFPPGGATIYSLPALTIGRPARGADAISASDLVFNGKARWSEAETVFSRARSLGFSTALVGWLHPYRRVLGKQLDRCEWYPYPPYEEERGVTIGEAAVNQVCSVISQFQQRRLHLRNATAAHATAEKFLTESPAALTLIHLPVPHPPGIYDTKAGRFSLWKYSPAREYLENLVLVDQQVGTLRRAMENNGTWNDAWVILSSDHWWRESAQYDGKTDHRVPFIVKAPGQNQPTIYDKKFDTAVTYHLILSILKGELKRAAELSEWLDNYRTVPPASYTHRGEPL